MKKYVLIFLLPVFLLACSGPKPVDTINLPLTDTGLISKGKYLVTIGGCNDCHSPKMMTEQGPVPDPARLLSGHPANEALAPFDTVTTKGWLLFNMSTTAIKGPWGFSFAANLTPDDTGLGGWTEAQFSTAIRKGWFKGMEGGRRLLPPMPWQSLAGMKDEDVHAVFAYLQSLPRVKNRVPDAIPPGS